MSIRNLDRIFRPKRIAVVGASNHEGKVGYRALRNLVGSGFPGVVYPVNLKGEPVQGIHAYPNVAGLPSTPDLAVICTPAAGVAEVVKECGEAGIRGIVILSAGFGEVGAAGRELEDALREQVRRFGDMRVIGPNCLGIMVPALNLNASFASASPTAGNIAFISQSGALCTAVLDWALDQGIGFSHFVSVGNMLDVGFADLIDYLGQSGTTRSIILYIESITEAREFMSAARAFARSKPIVAYKAGRFAESAKAAMSHTGALAGDDEVFDAAAQRAGIERVFEMEDMFDCAELLAHHAPPRAARLGIVTNAGGPGVMATDALMARRGRLAELSDETMGKLDEVLPSNWSHGNPVDVIGDAPPERYAEAVRLVADDDGVDALLVILAPQAMTDPTSAGMAVADVARATDKPILAAWMGGNSVREGTRILSHARVPTFGTPEPAVHAFMHMASYARNLLLLHETPREVSLDVAFDHTAPAERVREILAAGGDLLSEAESKELVEAYGIATTRPKTADDADEAARWAAEIGYPVALKIVSPQITHKTDVGGIELDVRDDDEARAAYERIIASVRSRAPEADIEGVSVQRMAGGNHAFELIMGARKDRTFGAVILVGTGGITAEVIKDFAIGLPPLNERLARRLLESLRAWPLLHGYRGRSAVNIDALIGTLVRFSYLVAEHPAIDEIDINPLLATPDEIIALDARVIVDREIVANPVAPYSHLAIRPVPKQYRTFIELNDGTPVKLRPIRPEDEPMWHVLLTGCSPESIYSRFFAPVKEFTHEMATRFCFIDYDREIAIVAEVESEGERKLVAVGRLVADPEHEEAEYAILVHDDYQHSGLGTQLTDYCMRIAEGWGIERVTAVTLPENRHMKSILRRFGFELQHDVEEGFVFGVKQLR
ncbi:MAG: GNAT family N-acetyltransferase [Acidobacteriota bacterium]|jgi:acetyltransferase